MTQFSPDNSLATAAARIDRADAALKLLVRQNRSRNFWLAFLMLLAIVFLCFYLSHAYSRFGDDVTPEVVASNAQAMFQNQLPTARQQLETNLRTNAPQYVGKALDQVETLPGAYADQLTSEAGEATDKAMPQVSTELYGALKHSLDEAKASKSNGTDEERFKSTLAALSQVYADETLKFVTQAHDSYAGQSAEFTSYLERLAHNQGLDRREQLHRDMFKNLLLMMRERVKSSGGDSLKLNLPVPGKATE